MLTLFQVRVVETTVFKIEAETEEEARRIASEDCIWGPDDGDYDVWIDVESEGVSHERS